MTVLSVGGFLRIRNRKQFGQTIVIDYVIDINVYL